MSKQHLYYTKPNFSLGDATGKSMGKKSRDQFYLVISGLDKVDFVGDKNIKKCLEVSPVGKLDADHPNQEADHTLCAAKQKNFAGRMYRFDQG